MCAICDFKIEFSVGHPHALAVAVATRKAIEAGLLKQPETEGALAQARLRMTAVDTLNELQGKIQAALSVDELLSLPDFYVLLIENDTWGFFHATENGFDPDIVPDVPDVLSEDIEARSTTIVTSQMTLRAWLDGEISTDQLGRDTLLFVDGSPKGREALVAMLWVSAGVAAKMMAIAT